jgi:hypothetical protein
MSDEARKQYKYVVLNSDRRDETETAINACAADGFIVDHVVPGYQRGPTTWSYAALIMSKDVVPS